MNSLTLFATLHQLHENWPITSNMCAQHETCKIQRNNLHYGPCRPSFKATFHVAVEPLRLEYGH